jgi:hypothetical protein
MQVLEAHQQEVAAKHPSPDTTKSESSAPKRKKLWGLFGESSQKVSRFNADTGTPPRPGLEAESGDPHHPQHWVRPEGEPAPAQKPAEPTQQAAPSESSPAPAKAKIGQRERQIVEDAKSIEVKDEPLEGGGEKIGSLDYDEIESALDDDEKEEMDKYLSYAKGRYVDSAMEDYDPGLSMAEFEKENWDDSTIQDLANAAIENHPWEKPEDKVDAHTIVSDWYNSTREYGTDAVDELCKELDTGGINDALVQKFHDDLTEKIEKDTQEKYDSAVEKATEAERASHAENYDDTDDRRGWLQDFYHDHDDEDRFTGGQAEEGKWGREKGSDDRWQYNFTADNGNKYEIWGIPKFGHMIGGEDLLEIGFRNEDKGSYGVTGSGGAVQVFSTVAKAVVALVTKEDLPAIYFSAAEPSRQKLYDTLVKTIAKVMPGYAAAAGGAGTNYKAYTIAKREYMDDVKAKIGVNFPGQQPQVLAAAESSAPKVEWTDLEPEIKEEWFTDEFWDEPKKDDDK